MGVVSPLEMGDGAVSEEPGKVEKIKQELRLRKKGRESTVKT